MERQYLDAVLDTLPATLRNDLQNLSAEQRATTDTLLRFVLGGPCPSDAPDALRREWLERQSTATQALQRLRTQTNGKRAREDEGDDEGTQEAKRARASAGDAEEDRGDEGEDKPLFTLHALSVTAPLRKKLDIRIHERSLRLLNPNTQAVEHTIPLSALRRAFLLPTRGKTRAHWTVLLMSADTPTPSSKAAAKDKEKDKAEKDVQLVFGVDAAPGAYSTTDHTATDSAPAQHARGTPVLPFLRAFLAHVPVPLREPDASVFRSATAVDAQGTPLAGVQAYRAAKEGTLWFFADGILWDGRPAEFWACADLVGSANAAGEAGTGSDGVRLVSATGRTCSVFVRRRVGEAKAGDDGEGEADDEEIECVETDFNMVDGREQDGISTWVRRHKHLFGRPPPAPQAEGYGVVNGKVDLKGKGRAVAPPAEDSEDEDDSDFVDEDDSDGGSATSESEEGSGDDAEGDEGEDEDEDEEEDADEDEEDVEELDPARHPLLRPGAMPKMSKAAMDAAVGMVMDDFVGGSGKGKGKAPEPQSDEEDELDD
ncbi:Rtt106 domain-containing protein [Phanerochaete sordida]|uniref:Rtt106 domain-containing protein n=1 Tax=Phanerochaete sordida TaxID=48140 RepID=A0A9P3GGU0_9APHY|nr:Rtt106 domain-containing protein [Phanerochaete sordida]